jgi:hypothetical protein
MAVSKRWLRFRVFLLLLVLALSLFGSPLAPPIAHAQTIGGTLLVSDVNGGTIATGDILEYTAILGVSAGTANNVSLNCTGSPFALTYVPGSLVVVTGPNAGAKTDPQDADQAYAVASSNFVNFFLGTGATGTAGGSLPTGQTTSVSFRFRVVSGAAAGTTITTNCNLTYQTASGLVLTTTFNRTATVGQAAAAVATPTTPPGGTATVTATATVTRTATVTATATLTATATRTPGPSTPTATPVIPEWSPLWLFGSGALALGWLAHRVRRRRDPSPPV